MAACVPPHAGRLLLKKGLLRLLRSLPTIRRILGRPRLIQSHPGCIRKVLPQSRLLLIVRGVQQVKINEDVYLAGRKLALESSTQREGRLRLGGRGGVGCDGGGGGCDGGR
jgi:hypothetical protein